MEVEITPDLQITNEERTKQKAFVTPRARVYVKDIPMAQFDISLGTKCHFIPRKPKQYQTHQNNPTKRLHSESETEVHFNLEIFHLGTSSELKDQHLTQRQLYPKKAAPVQTKNKAGLQHAIPNSFK
ncbi:hypothetical protein M758_4G085900 [Ceratodon purpureus]|nr:hypothetical protein M758_4G085900 [Ceratodon purpureus]